MSHVKAWYVESTCGAHRSGHYLRKCVYDGDFSWMTHREYADGCEGYEPSHRTVARDGREATVIDDTCKHARYEHRFIERDYKRVEVMPSDFGWYWLRVGRASYDCFYLEVDGQVACDLREDVMHRG